MDMFLDAEFKAIIPPLSKEEYDGLDASIAQHGNIVPVVIWKEKRLLLDGHNRYDLCQKHGKELKPPIEMSFPDRDAAMVWVLDNQLSRRNLSSPVRIDLAELKHGIVFRQEARKRIQEHGNTAPGRVATPTQTFAEVLPEDDRTVNARIGKEAGVSREQVRKYQQVKAQAAPDLLAAVRRGEKTINQAFVAVRREEAQVAVKTAEWPTGKYRIIYADPPWQYQNNISADKYNDVEVHYPTMPMDEICALPVRDMALDNAVLFLWATSPLLEDAFRVVNAWGFRYKTSFVWDKVKKTFGHYNGVRHELLLVAVRGSCQPDVSLQPDSVVSVPKTDHSAKPEEFRQIIESLYPYGPRVELFARKQVENWDTWGNQVND